MKSGTIGEINPERAFQSWAKRHPVRAQKHVEARIRVSRTRDAWAIAHQYAGDGIKQAE